MHPYLCIMRLLDVEVLHYLDHGYFGFDRGKAHSNANSGARTKREISKGSLPFVTLFGQPSVRINPQMEMMI